MIHKLPIEPSSPAPGSADEVAVQSGALGTTIAVASTGRYARGLRVTTALLERYALVGVLVVLVAVISARQSNFVSETNLLSLLQQWAPVGIMAIAGTYVIIAGGFDLSVGGMYVLGGVVAAELAQRNSMALATCAALGAGLAAGLANGVIVTKLKVNPFIATLGTGAILTSFALVWTAGSPVMVSNPDFSVLGRSKVGPFSLSAVVLLALFVVGAFVLARTVYGRKLYAVGGNRDASLLVGLRNDRLLISTYVLSGVAAAFAGVLIASRLGQGQPSLGQGIEFDVVIAIILGGTAISGGSGAMWRTFVGLALLAVMQNGLDTLQVDAFYQNGIKGAILVLALAWDEYVQRRRLTVVKRGFIPAAWKRSRTRRD